MIESAILNNAHILVVGCGGIGGYVIESLVRLGFINITAIDGDLFDKSNLNRQLYATSKTIGENKALVAKKRAQLINSNLNFVAIEEYLTESNVNRIVEDCDIIIDALDNYETRLLLEDVAQKYHKVIIHGAINACFGEVAVVCPGDNLLHMLYERSNDKEIINVVSSCAIVANLEVNEACKVLQNKEHLKNDELLLIDLETLQFNIIKIGNRKRN